MQSGSWTTSRVMRASGCLHQCSNTPSEESLGGRTGRRTLTPSTRKPSRSNRHQSRAKSFADAIRQGCPPAPAHYLSVHGSDSSPGITRSSPSSDREVIVHLGDADAVKRYRGITAKDIKRRTERVKVDAAIRLCVPTLASVAFVAVRVLKSGDICFTMRSAKEAEIHGHTKGPSADLGGHYARCECTHPRDQRCNGAAGTGEEAKVIKLYWAVVPNGKKSGSLVVELDSPVAETRPST
ncbi:uncharacterized protein N7477_009009 [Penicillium maclennaniae]|uniref:uncharacterized protein n=1 Tax=Penicillium maclennaniae TaxID=1343394 RepID=UPI0025401512|nr:uncharacterized protein N7477_009009 [Penicillium maclennaniae]KAJ5661393.1 hypothetical protein N7477_009009 [Penicillium maclennaniae]